MDLFDLRGEKICSLIGVSCVLIVSSLVSLYLLVEVAEVIVGSRVASLNILTVSLLKGDKGLKGFDLCSEEGNKLVVGILERRFVLGIADSSIKGHKVGN